jgi:hypothetical protein
MNHILYVIYPSGLVVSTILKNDGVRLWVSYDIPHMKWKKSKTNPNHQSAIHNMIQQE